MTPVNQDTLRAALLDPTAPVPAGLSDGAGRPAGRRFNVYRNNVAVSLTEAMRTAFPVITRLLGQQNMDGLSGLFLRAYPPSSQVMMFYGAEFPQFLAKMDQLRHLGYLPDVARLELAMRHAYHAADTTPIDGQVLAATPPEQLMGSTLGMSPALHLVCSNWPIYDIWRFNTQEAAPKPKAVPQDVIITRAEYDPLPQLLPKGGATWIAAVIADETIGNAHDKALRDTPDFDLGATLALLLQGNAISSLKTKD